MPRHLDHIVHAVHDLDAAASFYRRAGFQVGGRNKHPWGTHNCIIQLDGMYIELLAVAEPGKIVPHGSHTFSFGAFQRDYLKRREGLSMALLESDDAARDARQFRDSNIGDFDVFSFERQGQRADGATVTLAFSLAFASDTQSPEAGFATCQHHFPENFWNTQLQRHDNGARRIARVTLDAARPKDHAAFLRAFTGAELQESDEDLTFPWPRATFDVRATPQGGGLLYAAMTFPVANLAGVEKLLRDAGIKAYPDGECLIIPPETAFGATLLFEASQ